MNSAEGGRKDKKHLSYHSINDRNLQNKERGIENSPVGRNFISLALVKPDGTVHSITEMLKILFYSLLKGRMGDRGVSVY